MENNERLLLIPLIQFICDTCNGIIEEPKDGWFEWLQYNNGNKLVSEKFRICHHDLKCMRLANHQNVSDGHLNLYIYPDGLAHLYSFLDVGPYHQREYKGSEVKDIREYMEILRRFTVPYYEEARQYWNEAIADGYFEGASTVLIYQPDFLKGLIERYSTQR